MRAIHRNVVERKQKRLEEYKTWGRLSTKEMERLAAASVRLDEFYRYFERIPSSAKAVLTAEDDPRVLVRRLADPDRRRTFIDLVREYKLELPMGSRKQLARLVGKDYPAFAELAGRIQLGQRIAIKRSNATRGDRSLVEALAGSTAGFLEGVRRAGFRFSPRTASDVAAQARMDIDMKELARCIELHEVKGVVGRRVGLDAARFSAMKVVDWVTSKGRAQWLKNTIEERLGHGIGLSAERIEELASVRARKVALQQAAGDEIPSAREGLLSLPKRTRWLILVSLLVCIVGITNTMLMSVTDRFTQIATMKCLGAMDGFIMLMFVFEAMFQGVAGSIIGVVIGLFLAMLRGAGSFGGLVFEALPVVDLMAIGGLSFVTGIIVAAVAATWPSWAAARLAPMEAMRVE
ncbi:MAG: FtsX-like permease family protein [Chitinivibrionales bacterium]|nr:FtsX-like permease family protein [Chitinivibrionales bacterium]MBD3394188.1 FtsX-like permease family protein [Chitinivibrionales bacterium]